MPASVQVVSDDKNAATSQGSLWHLQGAARRVMESRIHLYVFRKDIQPLYHLTHSTHIYQGNILGTGDKSVYNSLIISNNDLIYDMETIAHLSNELMFLKLVLYNAHYFF